MTSTTQGTASVHRLVDMVVEEVSLVDRAANKHRFLLVKRDGDTVHDAPQDTAPTEGTVVREGGVGVMRQFVGSVRDDSTVRDLLVNLAPPAVREAGEALDAAELVMMERDDEKAQLAYAQALADWGDAGGYDAEVLWDVCTTAALGVPFER